MSESDSGPIFDLEHIRELAELMKSAELSELEMADEGRQIRLRRGADGQVFAAPAPAAPSAAAAPAAADDEADESNIAYITAPMVGTFYARPNPNATPYVKVGDHVQAETVVCIVEAMKVFNEIPAEVSGKIVAVLVDPESPVEFGQKLFKVDTNG